MAFVQIPLEPEDACIESMCLRFDHGHGARKWSPFGQGPGGYETDDQFRSRQESNRRVMRQLYEEASGQGFFKRAAPSHDST